MGSVVFGCGVGSGVGLVRTGLGWFGWVDLHVFCHVNSINYVGGFLPRAAIEQALCCLCRILVARAMCGLHQFTQCGSCSRAADSWTSVPLLHEVALGGGCRRLRLEESWFQES